MTNKDFAQELTAYVDGELGPDEVKALEAALAADPKLRALEQTLRRTVGLMQAVPSPQASPALRRAVLRDIEAPTPWQRLTAFFTPGRLVPLGVLASAAVAVVVWTRSQPVEAPPLTEEQLFLAQNMDLLEEYDSLGLDSADDVDLVASLHELEVK